MINERIVSIRQEFETLLQTHQWCAKTKALLQIGDNMLSEVFENYRSLTEQANYLVNLISIGTLVTALSQHDEHYKNQGYSSTETKYKTPHYPIAWEQLTEVCGSPESTPNQFVGFFQRKNYSDAEWNSAHLILQSGEKILTGDFPCAIVRNQQLDITPEIDQLENRIAAYKEELWKRMEKLFPRPLAREAMKTQEQYDCLMAMTELRDYAINQHNKYNAQFSLDKIIALADALSELNQHVMQGNIDQSNIETFKKKCQPFQTDKTFKTIIVKILYIASIENQTSLIKKQFGRIDDETHWANEAKCILLTGSDLLDELLATPLPDAQKKYLFKVIAIGAWVSALAYNDSKYRELDTSWISTQPEDKYYQVHHYPILWEDLFEICKARISMPEEDPDLNHFPSLKQHKSPTWQRMIFRSGKRILNEELPFHFDQMVATWPELEDLFTRVRNQRPRSNAEALFELYTDGLEASQLSEEQTNYLTVIKELQEYTLAKHDAQKPQFSYEKITTLASCIAKITQKIMTNSSVTQNEYDALVKACRPFRAYRPFNMIYAALLGILAGIVTGLVLTPSVAVCAVAGGATSALAYGFGMWAKRRSNPIFKVERMVASQLSTEEGVTSKPS